jgi:hypothetical protein
MEKYGPQWSVILLEEVWEAIEAGTLPKLRAELIQVAAVCWAWIEQIDAEHDV